MALCTDYSVFVWGTLWCSGNTVSGPGDGTSSPRTDGPITANYYDTPSSVIGISSGFNNAVLMQGDGYLLTTGDNLYKQVC
jgi:hypothetical protein